MGATKLLLLSLVLALSCTERPAASPPTPGAPAGPHVSSATSTALPVVPPTAPRAFADLPVCPPVAPPKAAAAPTEQRPLPDRHPFDLRPADRAAHRVLVNRLCGKPWPPSIPAGHGFDEVRRLLQPSLTIPPVTKATLTETERQVLSELAFGATPRRAPTELEADLLGLLAELVRVDSQSREAAGNLRVRELLAARLAAIGFTITHHPKAGVTLARLAPPQPRGARLLLLGHTDTVLPSTAFEPPLCRRDGALRGSGVGDMKGGLVVLVAALEALHRTGALAGRQITVLLNSDEEIGSHASRPFIAPEAGSHDLGLCFESGKITPAPGGGLTLARKGILGLDIVVRGRSAHSGVAHHQGVDAGRIAARIIESIGTLTDYRKGTTANIGVIQTNADSAGNRVLWRIHLDGEIRYWDPNQRAELERQVKLLVAGHMACNPYIEAARATCSDYELTMRGRPPSPSTPARLAWFAEIAGLAEALGTPVSPVASGGASDMNLAVGLDMLDSFGPIGRATHTSDETIPFDSLATRTRLTALTIHRTGERPPAAGR
ncbi:MAG: M20/M25/M40 family metallo-hydrolase [Deltaproteobacteria bacterium]|nr:M20/M25/M40 family metallo-hydrolase [Deltaproteobacteria bacterium]